MADWNFYKRHLGISDADVLYKLLCDTLIETNRTYDFFVNWTKVFENRDIYKYELALLKSLKGSTNPTQELSRLLVRYPEVAKVIPFLLACRDGVIKVLDTIDPRFRYKTYDFFKGAYSPEEISELVLFVDKSGLLETLCRMDSSSDYLLGVEVGLDSNARKNRSGAFLERLVRETISEIVKKHPGLIRVEQKDFGYIESKYGVPVPLSLSKRKFDHVVINQKTATNIELNFYGGTGSKPGEIVSSYINRGQVLSLAEWKFVWLTDGEGWRAMRNPLYVGIENIPYVINVYLLRRGILENIILNQ